MEAGSGSRPSSGRGAPIGHTEYGAVRTNEAEARAESRQEAAPAAVAMLAVFLALALASRAQGWEPRLPVDLAACRRSGAPPDDRSVTRPRGTGLVQSRRAALALLGSSSRSPTSWRWRSSSPISVTARPRLLGGGSSCQCVSRSGAPTSSCSGSGSGDRGQAADSSVSRAATRDPRPVRRTTTRPTRRRAGGRRSGTTSTRSPTNSIAPVAHRHDADVLRAEALMGVESAISAVTVLLVAARAVNVLGS